MIFESLVTLLSITRTTNLASRFAGVQPFLPALSSKRWSTLGGIEESVLIHQMRGCKSFADIQWSTYWTTIAFEHLDRLDKELGNALLDPSRGWLDDANHIPSPDLIAFLHRGAAVLTQCAAGTPVNLDRLCENASDATRSSLVAMDAILKAVAYFFIAAWPGRTPNRDKAYGISSRLFDILLDAVALELQLKVERHVVKSGDEDIPVYGLRPSAMAGSAEDPGLPAVLITNGLEGTNAETILPFLRTPPFVSYAWYFMEMPGTYSYKNPMKRDTTEQTYHDVISFIESRPYIDKNRLGFMGLSFGAYWAVRMAISDHRLVTVVANGAPMERSSRPSAAFGMPQITTEALANTVGTKNLRSLATTLQNLSCSRSDIESIPCPILAINGDKDTLVSTQDTVDVAAWAPKSELKLYPNDDHCAIGHIQEWVDLSIRWFDRHLLST